MEQASRVLPIALAIGLSSFLATSSATSQPADDRFAWAENVGWIQFVPRNAESLGFASTIRTQNGDGLTGYAYGENIGWISLGRGGSYPPQSQQNGDEINGFGVRIESFGVEGARPLSGYAYGENIGWINFGTFFLTDDLGMPAPLLDAEGNRAWARFEDRRLRGYAWAENIGWINLDAVSDPPTPGREPGIRIDCHIDFAAPFGVVNSSDINAFVSAFVAGDTRANLTFNQEQPAIINASDINVFVNAFLAGCP